MQKMITFQPHRKVTTVPTCISRERKSSKSPVVGGSILVLMGSGADGVHTSIYTHVCKDAGESLKVSFFLLCSCFG